MRKKLARGVVLVSAFMMLSMSLMGCKKKTECDVCGEVKRCDKYEFLGEEIYMCDDCHKELEALGSMFK